LAFTLRTGSTFFSISRIFAVSACMATVASWQALTKALLAWNMRASASEVIAPEWLGVTRPMLARDGEMSDTGSLLLKLGVIIKQTWWIFSKPT
jgi:hypothetical protein